MFSTRNLISIGAAFVIAATGAALAETMPEHSATGPDHQQMMQSVQHRMGPEHMQEMMRQHHAMMPMSGHPETHSGLAPPTMSGQDAFGAIQEIVQILDADPKTDWSRVDLEALRQHLIDMNEVMLRADAAAKQIDGGLEVAVTGSGRTPAAIQRMLPAWAQTMKGENGWSIAAAPLPNGELLTATSTDPKEVRHIRGLGFVGLLASGTHHQAHHLAMAKGEFAPAHSAK